MTTTPAPSYGSSPLTGTTVGPFPTGFKYEAAADLRVWLELDGVRQGDLTLTTHYAVSGANPSADGGAITLSGDLVPASGWSAYVNPRLVWRRKTIKRQALALPDTEGHKPRETERALDKLMRTAEEHSDLQALALSVPVGEPGQQLPAADVRLNRLYVGGGAGEPLKLLEGSEQVVTLNAAGEVVPMDLVHVFSAIGSDLFDDGQWEPSDNPSSNDDGVWG